MSIYPSHLHAELENSNLVRIEISSSTLADLIKNTKLCAADIRSLDNKTKNTIWSICLKNCTKKQAY